MKDNSLLIPPFPDESLNAAKVSDSYYTWVLEATPSQTGLPFINEDDNTSFPHLQMT